MATTQLRGQQVKDGDLTDADIATANKDGVAGTASMRTLGTGALQAAVGNDPRPSVTVNDSTNAQMYPVWVADPTSVPNQQQKGSANLRWNPSTATLFVTGTVNATTFAGMVTDIAVCEGRLTLVSGTSVSTADQAAKTNIYFALHNGNRIGLYDGTNWKLYTFTELTLALGTVTAGLPYDVFVYDNVGVLTLEKLAWTNATTRATAIAYQDGVACKSGALTRRHLGTFYTDSTTTTADTLTKRYLINRYNKVPRKLFTCPGYNNNNAATSYNHTSTTFSQVNGATGSTLKFLADGICPVIIGLTAAFITPDVGNAQIQMAISVPDSTTSAQCVLIGNSTAVLTYTLSMGTSWPFEALAEGYHAVDMLAYVSGGTAVIYADGPRLGSAADPPATFLSGWVWG